MRACGALPDLAEHRPRREGPVELPQAPQQAAVAVGVIAIQGQAVVEVDQQAERTVGMGRPGQDGLSPGHAQVVVQLAAAQQRALRQVPQRFIAATA